MSDLICADCGNQITGDNEPPDGWQLEDGRTVCGKCCADDLRRFAAALDATTENRTDAN